MSRSPLPWIGRSSAPDLIRSRQIDPIRIHRGASRQGHCTISRGQGYSLVQSLRLQGWRQFFTKYEEKELFIPRSPPCCPCTFNSSLKAIAAPCLTSHEALNRSTSSNLTTPSQTHVPIGTSNAFDWGADLAETAPPLDGSMTTLSEDEGPFAAKGLPSLDLGSSVSSAAMIRALDSTLELAAE